ncbi:hypothetical protein PIB30_033713 [Stylosanthes scabra]|uniref:Uncharacterized protein n=1 Tax=Stylosanthes scabra TaxID=79078 RepID=A0ABU6YD83_9FABA|nr:hypothetical protein [Stylosanthes scabra]
MEEMSRMMAAFYDPLRPGSSATAGGLASSTTPPLPPHPPPQHPHPEGDYYDDDYEDAVFVGFFVGHNLTHHPDFRRVMSNS